MAKIIVSTPIVDKNGKHTTVHKKADEASASTRAATAPVVVVSAAYAAAPELPRGPLSTNELEEATASVPYPSRNGDKQVDKDAWAAARREYDLTIGALEHQWAGWLHDEYASDLPHVVQSEIFRKAWDDGHSSGYNNVESQYEEIAAFARRVAVAVRAE